MNVEIGTEAPIFLFWEYLFQIFGILSLQCGRGGESFGGISESIGLGQRGYSLLCTGHCPIIHISTSKRDG
jgi:hypothetical protein